MNITPEYPQNIHLSFTLSDYDKVLESSDTYFLDKYPKIVEALEKSNAFMKHYKTMIDGIAEIKKRYD